MGGGGGLRITQKTRDIQSFLFQYWANVVDGGLRMKQEFFINVSVCGSKRGGGAAGFSYFFVKYFKGTPWDETFSVLSILTI